MGFWLRNTVVVAVMLLGAVSCVSTPSPIPCKSDSDCNAGVCALTVDGKVTALAAAPLTCQNDMQGALPHETCNTSDQCDHGLCAVGGSCIVPCVSDDDCSAKEHCVDVFVAHQDTALRARGCLLRAQVTTDVNVQSEVIQGAFSGAQDSISLPSATEPTVYVIEHLDDSAWPFSTNCRPPLCAQALRSKGASPTTLFAFDQLITDQSTPIANWPYAFPLTIYVGNNLDPVYSAKGYGLDVISEVAGDARITTLSRAEDTRRILDLNIFYAGVAGLTPGNDSMPKPIAMALNVVTDVLAQAEITLGTVTQRAIPSDLLARGNTFTKADDPRAGFDVLRRGYGVWPELPALLALSAGAPNAGINIFLVSDIEGMGDGEVQALSGGTPGPMGMQGTGASGIAIAADMLVGEPDKLGRTIVHEMGHYLGLFHTSESDGSVLDPLADTPECTLAQDSNNDALLTVGECSDYGADNLMFWSTGAGTTLTSDQITILQRALILR